MTAHLFRDGRTWRFSGYNAGGDPFDGAGDRAAKSMKRRPFDAVIDVGRDFKLTEDGRLYLTGLGRVQFSTWTPEALVLAAKLGHFGFKVIEGRV